MASSVAPAKIELCLADKQQGRLNITEHWFDVPKDYSKPDAGTIRIFARSAKRHENPIVPADAKARDQLPWMCFLQGGPGLPCRPPQQTSFTQTVLDRGYQLLLMDSRGTGLSSPITASTLQMRGYSDVQAQYLKHFRADSIVRDCEAIRQALTAVYPAEKRQWSIMGQSFGGFCSLTYLSFFPRALRESFLFGGLQPLVSSPDEVYRRLFTRVAARNEAFYRKFPEDIVRVKTVLNYLQRFGDGKIKLPSEGRLTRRRFLQMGILLGTHGGVDALHDIVLRASADIAAFGHLTRPTLAAIDQTAVFDENLLYAILHEPIYCQGTAPSWSAERVMQEFPAFALDPATAGSEEAPVYFTGEMIFPSMFEDYPELAKVQDVAEMVAKDAEWPALFDEQQLARNEVPVYAVGYMEDMYVDFELASATAKAIKGCKTFTTNVLYHDAIRSKMDEVVKQAFALRDDVVD
nr:proline iminopeptidase [Quercus suber]